MTASQPDRLDRIELMLERLVNIQSNQQNSLEHLIDGQLGLQSQMGRLSEIVLEVREESRQLKRAVDYLLSRDGETGQEGNPDS